VVENALEHSVFQPGERNLMFFWKLAAEMSQKKFFKWLDLKQVKFNDGTAENPPNFCGRFKTIKICLISKQRH
jgi:hypothetical protein